jgi:hypothetical protein
MKHLDRLAAAAALCLGASALPALAAGSASSASLTGSSASSASVGSVSDSFKASSDGSSKTTAAQGDYKVIEVAAVADRPGTARLRLQALVAPEGGEVLLDLPAITLERNGVAVGQTVAVQARPYGLEFARGDTGQAFYLVLDDDWHRELRAHAVAL